MPAVKLNITVRDVDSVMTSFNVIRIKRSITGETGEYNLITANAPAAATLLAPNAEPYDVVGKTLQILRDSHAQVDVLFTGGVGDLLSAAQVASQINAEVGVVIGADESGTLRLSSTITGTQSKMEIVGGSAATIFGWDAGDRDIGEEAHIDLQTGITLYEFIDNDGEAGYYYKASYYNTSNGLASNDSSPFLGAVSALVSPSKLSVGKIDLVDAQGVAVPDQEITFYSVYEPLQVEGFQIALVRDPITIKTDSSGHAEITLVRGLKVKVSMDGTSFIREITVPDVATFDILEELSTAPDPFDIHIPDFPVAPRRTV